MSRLSDALARDAVVVERARNVVVEASAGTGKTTLIVNRIVELVAPRTAAPAIPMSRLAAVTFTRKAAGELRVRTRQQLLSELAKASPDECRATALRAALAAVDTAYIGTIHSVADRLLRRWPIAARLDPHYELEEHEFPLLRECFDLLTQNAEAGTLDAFLEGAVSSDRVAEACETLRCAQESGLRLRSFDGTHRTVSGVDAFVAALIGQRDVELVEPAIFDLDRAGLHRHVDELEMRLEEVAAASSGARWLHQLVAVMRSSIDLTDPAAVYRELVSRIERGPRGKAKDKPRLGIEFAGDAAAWDAWKAFDGDVRVKRVRASALRDDLLAPLRRWLAVRLIRLRAVVLPIYERVKRRYQAVDHVDLLLRLRDLLRDDLVVRADCQGLFDHVFVDEFQDTDPLQAEIVMFLCEQGATSDAWDAVTLTPGKLTIVGDPKQSIYRFRRADIITYRRVIELVRAAPCLSIQLVSSFRSTPALVEWLNRRCAAVLGPADDGPGGVAYQSIAAGRSSEVQTAVHALEITIPPGVAFDGVRELEAEALARYLRRLVTQQRETVVDRWTGRARPIEYGDIAVLAISTTSLPVLFAAFDRDAVPHAARGGTLFLSDPLVQQFLLGLCSIADRDDGAASVGLLRPPFFAVGLHDLARHGFADVTDSVADARAIVTELRRRRFERSPGATARCLLEGTGIGRIVALGPNGRQRLDAIRELCFQLDVIATTEHVDFDATIELVRGWLVAPGHLDPPHPVSTAAVRVTTIHQAKGLEFPIVALWDTRAAWSDEGLRGALTIDRSGAAWAVRLEGLSWDEPAGVKLADQERALREAERRRLVYVAATRARDLLVIPTVTGDDGRWVWSSLLGSGAIPDPLVRQLEPHARKAAAAWYLDAVPPTRRPQDATELEGQLGTELQDRWAEAAKVSDRPVAFTDASSTRFWWGRAGRFGSGFGEVVHLAIAQVIRDGSTTDSAVGHAMIRVGLKKHAADAAADVERALVALGVLGVLDRREALRVEYPLACRTINGELTAGYADLVIWQDDRVIVIDFKTDAAPTPEVPVAARYLAQVRGYAAALEQSLGAHGRVSAALLFTVNGTVHWTEAGYVGC